MMQTDLKQIMFGKDNLERIVDILSNGGLILYPTDTIWAIGCDATNPEAVQKIIDLKKMPQNEYLIALVNSIDMLKSVVPTLHPRIETLLNFHTRPLTVFYDDCTLPSICARNNNIDEYGVRLSMDSFSKEIINRFGKPLIGTSANTAGATFPANFGEIRSDILIGVDYVVKWKQTEKSKSQPAVMAKIGKNEELIFLEE